MRSSTIARVTRPGLRTFERSYVRRGRPVVIEGAVDVPDRLDVDLLARRCGDAVVRVREYPGGPTGHYARRSRSMRLSEYVDYLRTPAAADGELYLANFPVHEVPGLGDLLPFPDLVDARYRVRRRGLYPWAFWLGRDTVGPMHYHLGAEALATQLLGRKRFVLFPPSETRHLYADLSLLDRDRRNTSRVPWVDPDVIPSGFSGLAKAAQLEVILEPGEMLYIPTHWWHAVFGEDVSLLTAAFWPAPPWRWHQPVPGLLDLLGDPVYGVRTAREAALTWVRRRGQPAR